MGRRWSDDEVKALQECYLTLSYKEIGLQLGFTEEAIKSKAVKLGLYKNKRWTDDEVKILKEKYQQLDVKQLATQLNRHTSSIRDKARHIRIKPILKEVIYTPHTIDKSLWHTCKICNQSIQLMAKEFGGNGTPFSKCFMKHMKSYHRDISIEQYFEKICELPRPICSCGVCGLQTLVSTNGKVQWNKTACGRFNGNAIWTTDQINFLINNYQKLGPSECSKQLNRSKKSVYNLAHKLNLKIDRNEWTQNELVILQNEYPISGLSGCLKLINRTSKAIAKKACALGLSVKVIPFYISHPHLLEEWDANNPDPSLISAGSKYKAKWKCKLGHKWTACVYTRANGCKCPVCVGRIAEPGFNDLTSLRPDILKDWDYDNNIKKPQEITVGSGYVASWRCSTCNHKWEAPIDRITKKNGSGCPICKQSHGEKNVNLILLKYNITFIQEKKFPECKNINSLPFDFFLPDYNTCIEYHGIQHYKPVEIWGGQTALEECQKRDQIKRDFCEANHIRLIEIKYTEIDDIESILVKELELDICPNTASA